MGWNPFSKKGLSIEEVFGDLETRLSTDDKQINLYRSAIELKTFLLSKYPNITNPENGHIVAQAYSGIKNKVKVEDYEKYVGLSLHNFNGENMAECVVGLLNKTEFKIKLTKEGVIDITKALLIKRISDITTKIKKGTQKESELKANMRVYLQEGFNKIGQYIQEKYTT